MTVKSYFGYIVRHSPAIVRGKFIKPSEFYNLYFGGDPITKRSHADREARLKIAETFGQRYMKSVSGFRSDA